MATVEQRNMEQQAASSAYTEFLMQEEGFRLTQYPSAEKGTNTIGVGHKLKQDEVDSGHIMIGGEKIDYRKGLTEGQVHQLAQQDVDEHYQIAKGKYNRKYGKGEFEKLNPSTKFLITDFQYNLGSQYLEDRTKNGKKITGIFKDFTQAIRDNDWERVAQNYERNYSPGVNSEGKKIWLPLKSRNDAIYQRYILPQLKMQRMIEQDNPLGF